MKGSAIIIQKLQADLATSRSKKQELIIVPPPPPSEEGLKAVIGGAYVLNKMLIEIAVLIFDPEEMKLRLHGVISRT